MDTNIKGEQMHKRSSLEIRLMEIRDSMSRGLWQRDKRTKQYAIRRDARETIQGIILDIRAGRIN
jgi:hypothetical protein